MNFIDELKWRGMLHDLTPGAEKRLTDKMAIGYIGFDPTAPSMTIGNYVQIMLLAHWQRCGNKPIVLMGGATGRIGDPSGKDAERQLKSTDELDGNLERQKQQVYKFLEFDKGDNRAEIINNYDFYKDMNVLDFLRTIGKTLTVNYMLSKDSVKNRIESGISFTEFSYQLLQAYDFQNLIENHDCSFQMGGSDQWGNITSGIEFIRKNLKDTKAYAVTTPLLTKADGKKFGKSEEGNIWLDPDMTSPYKFYQFLINTADPDLPKMFRYFSFKSKSEIEALEDEFRDNPNELKSILAEEMTVRVHSREAYNDSKNVSQIIFDKKLDAQSLKAMEASSFEKIKAEIPSYSITQYADQTDLKLIDLLAALNIVESKSEARRAVKSNALSCNKIKTSSADCELKEIELVHGKYIFLENGKKNKFLLFRD